MQGHIKTYMTIAYSEHLYFYPTGISINYNPPPGFIPGLNEYRAGSGPVDITCMATEGSDVAIKYQWSSTCRDCPFQSSISSNVTREVVHSGDTGTHTCTGTRGGQTASSDIEFKVVGT